jgi:transposase-like protein
VSSQAPISKLPDCPHCGRATYRVRRRQIDKLLSLFVPLRRFRCGHCGWEGNRRDDRPG